MLAFALVMLALQNAPAQAPAAENPGAMAPATSWTGCVVAGSEPSAFRLNLDGGTAVAGPNDPSSLGDPFLQLLPRTKMDLAPFVGKHVTVRGKELSPEEAARHASLRPDQQEANATAGGTGGRPERHLRYVSVTSIKATPGTCR